MNSQQWELTLTSIGLTYVRAERIYKELRPMISFYPYEKFNFLFDYHLEYMDNAQEKEYSIPLFIDTIQPVIRSIRVAIQRAIQRNNESEYYGATHPLSEKDIKHLSKIDRLCEKFLMELEDA